MMSRKHPDRESPPPMPGWVKAFGIAVLAIALLVVLVMATGHAREHGPGQHVPGGHTAIQHVEPQT